MTKLKIDDSIEVEYIDLKGFKFPKPCKENLITNCKIKLLFYNF